MPKSFVATVSLQGEEFPFRLYHRPLRLGDFATIDYYWMDSSEFRRLRSESAFSNFRSTVGFWGAAMRKMGVWNELDEQIHYVLAISYALVSRSKSLQDVYLDAYLPTKATVPEQTALPEVIRECIKEVVKSRSRYRLKEELDRVFGRFRPPASVFPSLQEAFRRWVGNGVTQLRLQGNDGLEDFLKETEQWLGKYRKRSDPLVRTFINMFATECKTAFYTCYANAWIGIIPWLREHRQLDPISETFLGFWHNQNQAIEIPLGQTPGGILYPTSRGISVVEPQRKGYAATRSIKVATERIGPEYLPDVFSGHVLSLHPLSGFFMKDPALCAIAGRFFATDAVGVLHGRRPKHGLGAYWDLMGAILTAAHLYRQALDEQVQKRGVRLRKGAEQVASTPPCEEGEALLLEDYARSRQIRCSACGGELNYRRVTPPAFPDDPAHVEYTCRLCATDMRIELTWEDATSWFGFGK